MSEDGRGRRVERGRARRLRGPCHSLSPIWRWEKEGIVCGRSCAGSSSPMTRPHSCRSQQVRFNLIMSPHRTPAPLSVPPPPPSPAWAPVALPAPILPSPSPPFLPSSEPFFPLLLLSYQPWPPLTPSTPPMIPFAARRPRHHRILHYGSRPRRVASSPLASHPTPQYSTALLARRALGHCPSPQTPHIWAPLVRCLSARRYVPLCFLPPIVRANLAGHSIILPQTLYNGEPVSCRRTKRKTMTSTSPRRSSTASL